MVQASRKVRPFLEQAAAASAAAANSEGTAKAQAAAKKAKKLTPEEMKKMRQQADPNYQAKQAAASTATAHADGPSKKGKKAKAVAGQSELPSETASKALAASRDKLPGANPKPEVAATHLAAQTAAQAQADHGAASGNKRRQGLGFAEEQAQPKRAKPAPPDPAAADNTDSAQRAQQAQAGSNSPQDPPSSKVAGDQQQTKAGLQNQSAAAQAAGLISGASGPQQPAAVAASQGPPVVFTDEYTAFVRGLDNKVTEAELQELLAACGQVKDVRLVMDKLTGRPKVCVCLSAVTVRQPHIVLHIYCSRINLSCTIPMPTSARGDAQLSIESPLKPGGSTQLCCEADKQVWQIQKLSDTFCK